MHAPAEGHQPIRAEVGPDPRPAGSGAWAEPRQGVPGWQGPRLLMCKHRGTWSFLLRPWAGRTPRSSASRRRGEGANGPARQPAVGSRCPRASLAGGWPSAGLLLLRGHSRPEAQASRPSRCLPPPCSGRPALAALSSPDGLWNELLFLASVIRPAPRLVIVSISADTRERCLLRKRVRSSAQGSGVTVPGGSPRSPPPRAWAGAARSPRQDGTGERMGRRAGRWFPHHCGPRNPPLALGQAPHFLWGTSTPSAKRRADPRTTTLWGTGRTSRASQPHVPFPPASAPDSGMGTRSKRDVEIAIFHLKQNPFCGSGDAPT